MIRKYVFIGIAVIMVIGLGVGTVGKVYADSIPTTSSSGVLSQGLQGVGEGLAPIGTQIGSTLATAGCGFDRMLYEMKLRLNDLWTPEASIRDLTHLLKNQCWRDAIWGVDALRDQMLEQQSDAYYKRCLLPPDDPSIQLWDDKIQELTAKREVFFNERLNFLEGWDPPVFTDSDFLGEDISSFVVRRQLDSSGMMDWLVPFDTISRYGVGQVYAFKELASDLARPFTQLPDVFLDNTFSILHVGGYFLKQMKYLDNAAEDYERWLNEQHEWLKLNAKDTIDQFEKAAKDARREGGLLSGSDKRDQIMKILSDEGQRLRRLIDEKQLALNRLDRTGEDSPNAEELVKRIAYLKAYMAFDQYLSGQVSTCGGDGALETIAKHLEETFDAVLGAFDMSDIGSRLDISGRLEKAKERQYIRICSQLEAMYRETGKDVSALPILGKVGDETYCKDAKACPEDKTWFQCMLDEIQKSLTVAPDAGLMAMRDRSNDQWRGDIGSAVNYSRKVQELQRKQQSFRDLRARYKVLYQGQGGLDGQLFERMMEMRDAVLDPAHDGVFDPDPVRNDPSQDSYIPPTYVSLLRHVYGVLYEFSSAVDGYCPAEKDPE